MWMYIYLPFVIYLSENCNTVKKMSYYELKLCIQSFTQLYQLNVHKVWKDSVWELLWNIALHFTGLLYVIKC